MSEAKRLYNQNLGIGRKLGNQSVITRTLYQLGRLARAQKKLSADSFYNKANQIFESLGEKADTALSKRSLDRKLNPTKHATTKESALMRAKRAHRHFVRASNGAHPPKRYKRSHVRKT